MKQSLPALRNLRILRLEGADAAIDARPGDCFQDRIKGAPKLFSNVFGGHRNITIDNKDTEDGFYKGGSFTGKFGELCTVPHQRVLNTID